MTSDKQIAANQKNALLGGVKTNKGKAISKLNALKHGILSEMVMHDEKRETDTLFKALLEEYEPQSPLEITLIERITIWIIRLKRAVKAEREKWLSVFDPRITKTESDFPKLDLMIREVVVNEGYKVKVYSSDIKTLDETYLRYENSLERNLYRAIHELQRLIAIRKGEKPQLPIAVDVTVDNATVDEKEE